MNQFRCMPLLLAVAAISLVHVEAPAQDSSDKSARPTIRVTGEATVTSKPDQAEINIGVVTQASTGQAAATQNAQKQDAVLSELRKVLGPAAEIKTISYSLNPNYRYPREGGQPTITGYTASNTVQVKTNDLTQVGKLIDVATQSGANTVQSLRFLVKDEQRVRAQALGEAAIRAKGKAEAIASALGLRVVRVLHIEESGYAQPMPINTRSFALEANAAAAPTPIESGTIDFRAMVTLTVEIAP